MEHVKKSHGQLHQEQYHRLRQAVLRELEQLSYVDDTSIEEVIAAKVLKLEREEGLSYPVWKQLETKLYNSLRKLDIIEELVQDSEVSEIMINGPDHIFYEKHGIIKRFPGVFDSEQRLLEVIDQIVGEHNRRVNTRNPIVDTRLADGSRVHIVLSPISLQGPVITIRKFKQEVMNLDFLIRNHSISQQAADYLERLVQDRQSILISGGTGSGKTTLLNALSASIDIGERIITIEDCAELQLQNVPNLIRLECRDANDEGTGQITMRDLIKASLRMRPDRIVVGEVRSAEALDLLQALNTGHQGSLSTIHANTCKDTFSRLETMVLMAMDLPIGAIRNQIASGIQVIVHVKKYPDGSRKVDEIISVDGMSDGEMSYHSVFVREGEELVWQEA